MHTCGTFVPKVLGFESHRFAGGKLHWMVNRDENLAAFRSFAKKLLGQRFFWKVCTGMHILHTFSISLLVASLGWLLETAMGTTTQEKTVGRTSLPGQGSNAICSMTRELHFEPRGWSLCHAAAPDPPDFGRIAQLCRALTVLVSHDCYITWFRRCICT